jgi:hypothetical protein
VDQKDRNLVDLDGQYPLRLVYRYGELAALRCRERCVDSRLPHINILMDQGEYQGDRGRVDQILSVVTETFGQTPYLC